MTEPTEPIDLDTLMSRDPLSLSDRDLDEIVTYFRRQRAAIDSGVRPRKDTAAGPKLDIVALGFKPTATAPIVRRKL